MQPINGGPSVGGPGNAGDRNPYLDSPAMGRRDIFGGSTNMNNPYGTASGMTLGNSKILATSNRNLPGNYSPSISPPTSPPIETNPRTQQQTFQIKPNEVLNNSNNIKNHIPDGNELRKELAMELEEAESHLSEQESRTNHQKHHQHQSASPLSFSQPVTQKSHTYPNGDVYNGGWKEGKPFGKGKMLYSNGDVYEGEFLNSQYNGRGRLTKPNGDYVQGCWIVGEKNGEFDELWNNGQEHYIGTYDNGKRNGKGMLKLVGEKVYHGEFRDDYFHGQGKLLFFKEQIKYKGEFRKGEMSGRGVMVWLQEGGTVYDGEMVRGIRDGFGVYTDSKNNKYVGYWKDDKKHGDGMFVTEQGAKFKVRYDMDRELEKELNM